MDGSGNGKIFFALDKEKTASLLVVRFALESI
jgi:hypothetical protein